MCIYVYMYVCSYVCNASGMQLCFTVCSYLSPSAKMAVTSVLFHNSVLRASYGLVVCEIDQWTCYSYGHPTDTVTIMGKYHCYSPYGCIIAMAMATGILLPQLRACTKATGAV